MSKNEVFVIPMNNAVQGPYKAKKAISVVAEMIHLPPNFREKLAAEIKSGEKGPWRIGYGFVDVTLTRDDPKGSLPQRKFIDVSQ